MCAQQSIKLQQCRLHTQQQQQQQQDLLLVHSIVHSRAGEGILAGISPTQCEAFAVTHHIQLCSNGTSLTYLAYLQQAQELIWLSVADIKTANQKHRNEQLNRTIQNFLYSLLATDNDVAAKKSLAVLTELWRRHVWRDARTVNVIGESASDLSRFQCRFAAAKHIQYASMG